MASKDPKLLMDDHLTLMDMIWYEKSHFVDPCTYFFFKVFWVALMVRFLPMDRQEQERRLLWKEVLNSTSYEAWNQGRNHGLILSLTSVNAHFGQK